MKSLIEIVLILRSVITFRQPPEKLYPNDLEPINIASNKVIGMYLPQNNAAKSAKYQDPKFNVIFINFPGQVKKVFSSIVVICKLCYPAKLKNVISAMNVNKQLNIISTA
jgi:hypothetical protein